MHGEYKQQSEGDKRLKYHLHAVSHLKYSLGTLMNEVIFLITMSGQFFFSITILPLNAGIFNAGVI